MCRAVFQSASKGGFIGEFEVSAHRKASSYAGYIYSEGSDEPGEIHRSGVPLRRWICCDDYLAHLIRFKPFEEGLHSELFRADAGKGVYNSAQNMVKPPVAVRRFDGEEVGDFLDHAYYRTVSAAVGAKVAGVFFGEGIADTAEADVFYHPADSVGEGVGILRRFVEEMKGDPSRASVADSRQARKFAD